VKIGKPRRFKAFLMTPIGEIYLNFKRKSKNLLGLIASGFIAYCKTRKV
jgi:hypothetical protein